MTISPDDIGQFFAGYASAFTHALKGAADLAAIAGHFAASFVESGPDGVSCANGDDVMKVLEKGYGYYRSIGAKEMTVTGVDSYPICEDHSVATVHWRGTYVLNDRADVTVDFDVHYLVRRVAGALKIFGSIAGDERGALRKAGII
ncbi:MAG: hypothetical protein AB7I36_10905 [Rhodospirillaceae bacterium]